MKKILCFRNSKLGDYLISLPAIELIKKKNKKCKIYYLTVQSKFYKKLPKKFNNKIIVDKFIYFNNDLQSKLKLIKILKSQNFSCIYYLQEKTNLYREIRDYFFFSLLGISKKYGFFIKTINYEKQSETLQIAKRVKSTTSISELNYISNIQSKIEKPIFNFKYISISIGGFSQPKIWKMNNWVILIKLILNKFNYKILITGTKEDIYNARYLSLINPKRILSLCGKNNIDQLFNIIKFSKAHITNDNGSMHIATLTSQKTLCLFNNHDPKGKWYPANKNAIIYRPNLGVGDIKPQSVFYNLNKIL